jgi:hypothetical protein
LFTNCSCLIPKTKTRSISPRSIPSTMCSRSTPSTMHRTRNPTKPTLHLRQRPTIPRPIIWRLRNSSPYRAPRRNRSWQLRLGFIPAITTTRQDIRHNSLEIAPYSLPDTGAVDLCQWWEGWKTGGWWLCMCAELRWRGI